MASFSHPHRSKGTLTMSEIRINLVDSNQILQGTMHGSIADRAVAALTAEPETIAELAIALSRYERDANECVPFAWFKKSCVVDSRPWDAGVMIIDLAARLVAIEST